jgi:hypothetical protein
MFTVMLAAVPRLAADWLSLVSFCISSSHTKTSECDSGLQALWVSMRKDFISAMVELCSKSRLMTRPMHSPLTNEKVALHVIVGLQNVVTCARQRKLNAMAQVFQPRVLNINAIPCATHVLQWIQLSA